MKKYVAKVDCAGFQNAQYVSGQVIEVADGVVPPKEHFVTEEEWNQMNVAAYSGFNSDAESSALQQSGVVQQQPQSAPEEHESAVDTLKKTAKKIVGK